MSTVIVYHTIVGESSIFENSSVTIRLREAGKVTKKFYQSFFRPVVHSALHPGCLRIIMGSRNYLKGGLPLC